ncbi:DUF3953 domain-containing protein [Psychrobacillus sp. FSL H8-0487]|uniref:DUF3953 domain-containing protein n=1 Tax=Psychrobacillus sp. FSL H8-0487 TaxID=2921391 RepID=UPI0030F55B13
MKIIKIILALVVMAVSTYGLFTRDFSYGPISSLLLGIFIAIIGIEEFKNKGKNSWGMFFILVSLLVIVVALFSF